MVSEAQECFRTTHTAGSGYFYGYMDVLLFRGGTNGLHRFNQPQKQRIIIYLRHLRVP